MYITEGLQIYDEDGSYLLNPTGVQESYNPLLDLEEVSAEKEERNDIMNVFLDITPFSGFKYRANVSRRSWDHDTEYYQTGKSLNGVYNDGMGQGYIEYQNLSEWQLENIFTYDYKYTQHSLNLTGVQSMSEKQWASDRTSAYNFPNDILGIDGIESAEYTTSDVSGYRRSLVSFVGRAQYDYDGKYYLTVSGRADASSVFGENNRWAFFPATAMGWNLYREDFLQDVDVVSNLKLRLSYGSVGNEAIEPYGSISTAGQADYIIDGNKSTGYVPGSMLPNPNLRWETTTTLNTAVDFGFWENRLSGTFEYYNSRTKDLLVAESLPSGSGYDYKMSNIGEIENQGIEMNVNGVIVDKGDWLVNAGFFCFS